MERTIGVIDLGSNTARLVLYTQDPNGHVYEIYNIKRTLRLSEHIREDGVIDGEGYRETLECLREFREICDINGAYEILGVATAAIRQAQNGPDLLEDIEAATGIAIRMLSGKEEAYYGYLAIVLSMKVEHGFTVDIGGGSTEITMMMDRELQERVSLPFGAVTLTRRFFSSDSPSPVELAGLEQFLDEHLKEPDWIKATPNPGGGSLPLLAIGGTARSMAKIHQLQVGYSLNSLHQFEMSRVDVARVLERVRQVSLQERRTIPGLSKDRADVIVAGVATIYRLMHVLGTERLIISNKGLRDGILYEYVQLSESIQTADDIVRMSAEQFMSRYRVNEKHARHVRDLVLSLYDRFSDIGVISGNPKERLQLELAALLHDIGRAINIHGDAGHTFYLLSNVLLMGVTHQERLRIAMIASYKNNKTLQTQITLHQDIVDKNDKRNLETLGQMLLLARVLDRSMTGQVREIKINQDSKGKKNLVLTCIGASRNLIEYTMLEDALSRLSKTIKAPLSVAIRTSDFS